MRTLRVNGIDRRYPEIEAWPALVGAAYLQATSVPVGSTPAEFAKTVVDEIQLNRRLAAKIGLQPE